MREVSGDMGCAREMQAHTDLLIAWWDCTWPRYVRLARLIGVRIWRLERKRVGKGARRPTSIKGYGSVLGFEKGRLKEKRRVDLGRGRDVSREEEDIVRREEEDVKEHEGGRGDWLLYLGWLVGVCARPQHNRRVRRVGSAPRTERDGPFLSSLATRSPIFFLLSPVLVSSACRSYSRAAH